MGLKISGNEWKGVGVLSVWSLVGGSKSVLVGFGSVVGGFGIVGDGSLVHQSEIVFGGSGSVIGKIGSVSMGVGVYLVGWDFFGMEWKFSGWK